MNKVLCCIQPTYIPWLPFFKRLLISDYFVLLDDVEYSKNTNHNRNSIRSKDNKIMLTVPIQYQNKKNINQIEIDNSKNWKKKHWSSISQNYNKSKYFKGFEKNLKLIYEKEHKKLIEVNLEIIYLFLDYFKINKKIYLSSKINIKENSNQKLIKLCEYFGANKFLIKKGTESYHPPNLFLENKIELLIFDNSIKKYKQLYNNFEKNLGVIDYASNCGNSLSLLKKTLFLNE